MSVDGLRPRAVERATAWLIENQWGYTRESLVESLRAEGYTDGEIEAATARAAEMVAAELRAEGSADLRGRAAMILLIVFVGTWVAITTLARLRWSAGDATTVGVILGISLGAVALPSLLVIGVSDHLRRGVGDAMVAILAVPFLLLFVIAGICVSTTGMLQP